MKKILSILLVGAIVFVALHDFYVEQFDKHDTIKQELHCSHLHHADFHFSALLPQTPLLKNEFCDHLEFSYLQLAPKFIPSINPPPPKTVLSSIVS